MLLTITNALSPDLYYELLEHVRYPQLRAPLMKPTRSGLLKAASHGSLGVTPRATSGPLSLAPL